MALGRVVQTKGEPQRKCNTYVSHCAVNTMQRREVPVSHTCMTKIDKHGCLRTPLHARQKTVQDVPWRSIGARVLDAAFASTMLD